MPSSTNYFKTKRRVRFGHCDPAGIAFSPQYLVMFNGLVEDWFTDALGIDYGDMLSLQRIGLPIVHLTCDFKAISRMGDQFTLALSVERLGHSSLSLKLVCSAGDEGEGEVRVTAHQVLVFTSLETHQKINVPSDVRFAIENFMAKH